MDIKLLFSTSYHPQKDGSARAYEYDYGNSITILHCGVRKDFRLAFSTSISSNGIQQLPQVQFHKVGFNTIIYRKLAKEPLDLIPTYPDLRRTKRPHKPSHKVVENEAQGQQEEADEISQTNTDFSFLGRRFSHFRNLPWSTASPQKAQPCGIYEE